jgi:hypothetical protein
MGVGAQHHAPATLPPSPGMTWYPLYKEGGWAQWLVGQMQKISPLPGFDPLTIPPIASRYANYAIPAYILYLHKYGTNFFL